MNKLLLTCGFVLLCGQLYAQQTPPASPYTEHQVKMMEAFHAVRSADIDAWTSELVKDEYRGRRTGDIGFDKAARWAANLMQEWGLKPMGDNATYFSNFDQPYNDVLGEGHLKAYFMRGKDTVVKDYVRLKDYFPSGQSDNGEVTAEVVYVGYGIHAPELGYDNYKGVDVKGKIVMCELGVPYKGRNNDSLMLWSRYQPHGEKITMARKQGAVGVLYVYPVSNCAPRDADNTVKVAFVSDQVARDLLAGSGKKLEDLRSLNDQGKLKAVATGNKVSIMAQTRYYPDRTGCNIVGLIEGTDPVLKNEYVMIGAHLDHLGMLPDIYPGALDNASGAAIVLAVGKALATSGVDMKRSVIITLFGAEEFGLLGAKHFIRQMPFEREKLVCMINIDMLGKGTGYSISIPDFAEQLVPYFRDAVENWVHRPFTARVYPWAYNVRPRTDGGAFANEHMPAIEFRGTGNREPIVYHKPEDTLHQLDPVFMEGASRALTMSIIGIANK